MQAQVDAYSAAWWKYWQAAAVPEDSHLVFEEALEGAPPMAPQETRWQIIKATGKCMSVGKAPGPDGWGPKHWRCWPDVLWQRLSELLRSIEKVGHWPHALRHAHVAMLPKGKPVQGLQARPITLLSSVYRLWARCKVIHLKRWFVNAGIEPLVGGREEAEYQAGLLSLTLGYGRATGEGGGGVAFDLSKAYDSVRLDLLERVLLGVGLEPSLVMPAIDMYRAPGPSESDPP